MALQLHHRDEVRRLAQVAPVVAPGSGAGVEPPWRFVSTLVGCRVETAEGHRAGRLRDLVVGLGERDDGAVRGLLVRIGGRDRFVPASAIAALGSDRIALRPGAAGREFDRRADQALLSREIVDRQVIDIRRARAVRVNDAAVGERRGRWHVVGVDLSARGLLRRLGPRRLRGWLAGEVTAWAAIEVLAPDVAAATCAHPGLRTLHAVDLARVIDRLPARHGAELLAALDDDAAADTLEEVEPTRRASVLDALSRERAATVLDRMAPDAAADLLADLPPAQVDELLSRMDARAAAGIRLLLSYPANSAGGLMTTDFVVAPESETTAQAVTYLRGQLDKPDLVYYVYVVDDADNQRLRGVVSLRDLLLAAPEQPLPSYMRRKVRSIQPEAPAAEAARVMREYNLLALPVVRPGEEPVGEDGDGD
jgi:magnesium transporter